MRGFNPRSIVFMIIGLIVLINMFGVGSFVPFIIAFFVFRSIIGKQQGDRRRDERGQNRNRRGQRRDYSRGRNSSRDFERPTAPPKSQRRPTKRPSSAPKNNPFKKSGIEKFKDYDYDGAIEDFKKALQVDPRDIAMHFNLACAYSLNEEKEKAFQHLAKAVEHGFVDFEKIKSHDALAYLRIQQEFDAFVKSGYHWPLTGATGGSKTQEEAIITQKPDLLQQLKQLGELRDKGLLTEAEFLAQKEKLMR